MTRALSLTRQLSVKVKASQRADNSNLSRRLSRIATYVVVTASVASVLLEAACVVGPRYARPSVPVPSAYKELPQKDAQRCSEWKVAQPSDAMIRGK